VLAAALLVALLLALRIPDRNRQSARRVSEKRVVRILSHNGPPARLVPDYGGVATMQRRAA
jgi:predicted membrane chloride channel (bestrophin family)